MSIRENQSKLWKMASLLILYAESLHDEPVVILDWDRTWKEQQALVARGASRTMNSKHLQGLAIDIAFLKDIQDDGRINYPKKNMNPSVFFGSLWEVDGEDASEQRKAQESSDGTADTSSIRSNYG